MKNITLLLALVLPFIGFSQSSSFEDRNKGLEFGLFLGGAAYEGDLHCFDDEELNYFSEFGLSFGLHARKSLSDVLGIRLNYRFAKLAGDDNNFSNVSEHPRRAFTFTNNLHEVAAIIDFEPFGNKKYDKNGEFKSIFSPFVYAGIGLAFGSANTDYNEANQSFDLVEKIGVDERDASGTHLAIPVGIGIKYYASESFSIGLQGDVRIATSDYLDGVKISGNPDANDYYGTVGLVLGFKLKGKPSHEVVMEEVIEKVPIILDTDSDGVIDTEDECPNEFGPRSNNGCPEPDSDGDGILDKNDDCPNEVGPSVNGGCPDIDTDSDGVVDRLDRCPDVAGIPEENGCPEPVVVDTDKDGFRDEVDKCPELFSLTNDGCPDETVPRIKDFSDRVIQFDNAEDLMRPESMTMLNELVQIMNENPDVTLRITGYTDSRGSQISNQGLSERRARQIYNYLLGQGIPANRMRFLGMGEGGAIGDNTTVDGRAINRRVVIQLVTK
jgi:outer membrane protein OmpA-like peptidoglycan-associated protein